MKHTHLFAFALAAALSVAPSFAQQDQEKPSEQPKAHEKADKDKATKPEATKPENGSVKSQEAGQEKTKPASHDSRIPQSDQEPGVKNPDAARQKDQTEHRDASRMPQSDQEAAPQDRDNRNEAHGQPNKHAEYHFKGDEKSKLRASYHDINRVDRSHRVTVVREQVMPVEIRTRIEPVPVDVVSYLPPAPEGYVFGFVDGYCVVYDPNTFLVVDVIDLF